MDVKRGRWTVKCAAFGFVMLMGLGCAGVPNEKKSNKEFREDILKQDLKELRGAIDRYTHDKHAAPQSLEDLVTAGYLRELPVDPITRSKDTWQPVMDETLSSIDQTEPGINDVRSGAQGSTLDGTPYGEL
jgi:general secretion pathway protein G